MPPSASPRLSPIRSATARAPGHASLGRSGRRSAQAHRRIAGCQARGGHLTCSRFDCRDRFSSSVSPFFAFVLSLVAGPGAVLRAAEAFIIARCENRLHSREKAAAKEAPGWQPDQGRHGDGGARLGREAGRRLDQVATIPHGSLRRRARTSSAFNRATRSRCATCSTRRWCNRTTSPPTRWRITSAGRCRSRRAGDGTRARGRSFVLQMNALADTSRWSGRAF